MKILFYTACFIITLPSVAICQNNLWTEKDRRFVLENLERTRNEVIKETANLTLEQWHFKENDTSWNIAQVIEHLGLYERTYNHEKTIILLMAPAPELLKVTRSDTAFMTWMNEPQPHTANKIHIPLGLMKGKDNLTFFTYGRELIIEFVRTTKADLKSYYTFRSGDEKRRSLHGLFVVHFGHTDRHLRQIRRIKQHVDFPR